MQSLIVCLATLLPGASEQALAPWAANRQPNDVAKRQVQDIAAARQEYRIKQGGTMDGTNCRSPIGGAFSVWDQTWESNRAVRMENVGDTDVINPWLSNGRNQFRTLPEIVAGAVRPGMTEREKAIALWRLQTTHRFHATTGDNEANDPVKVLNVYGYSTCGDDSICLAGLWRTAGLGKVRPCRTIGHCITQVFYDGRWNLLDGDMGPIYLLRDNRTLANEQDLVHDHDLLKRTHTWGILDRDSRAEAEASASLFVYDGNAGGDRRSVMDTTMNMVLRPNEALVWRWGHRQPLKYHGRADILSWGKKAGERICNGLWEYRPDFTRETWRKGAESAADVRTKDGALMAADGKTGVVIWKMHSPYVFVGGKLEVEGTAKYFLSWDGKTWQDVGENLDALFPSNGPARYDYQLKCVLTAGARLKRLAIVNDLQMAPLALPEMSIDENHFTYTDQTPGARRVRLTHEWVERSESRPPSAPAAAVFPADGGRTDGTDIVFEWKAPADASIDKIADYHFVLSHRADLAWPLSSNFEKLVSNTADQGKPRYTLPYVGLLTPGQKYYWRVRARNGKGVWGSWSKTWSFTADGPAQPLDVTLDAGREADGKMTLHWKPNTVGRKPAKYRIYGSDEKGFSVSDAPYRINVGASKEVPAQAPANFIAETSGTELVVLGVGIYLPNANKAFYRVVAVDEKGKRSGPSDYAASARPFIYSKPVDAAKVGTAYRYPLAAVRSLGDLRGRMVDGKQTASFWDIEKPRYVLTQGPAWLHLDAKTGILSGVPDAVGKAEVVVTVTLERSMRRLDEGRLSWGQELVKEVGTEKVGSAVQRFRIVVER